MIDYIKDEIKETYPSLYDKFELGDRVKRVSKNENGEKKTYKGIILSIDKKGLEIYWDTKNGKYRPSDMDIAFSHCELDEIFNGNKYYGPIEKS